MVSNSWLVGTQCVLVPSVEGNVAELSFASFSSDYSSSLLTPTLSLSSTEFPLLLWVFLRSKAVLVFRTTYF